MPLQLTQDQSGKFLVIHATGKLIEEDDKYFTPQYERISPHNGKLHVLFDMTGLQGWDAAAAWEDVKFDVKHFSDIERLAFVGEKPWQHGLATLFSPFTKATTRYFNYTEAESARQWLREP